MNTLRLALRNLLRNRRRSLATLLSLAIGSASLLLFGGYSADIRYSMLTGYVRYGGHLQVQHRDFFLFGSGNPTAYTIPNYQRLINAIRADPVLGGIVKVVSPTLQFGAIAGNYDAGVSRPVIGIGYVPTDVSKMRVWNQYDVRQVWPPFALDGAGEDATIVGIGVARVLLLCEPLHIENCPRPQPVGKPQGNSLPNDIAALAAGETAATPSPKKASAPNAGGARLELLASTGRGTPNVAALSVIAAEYQGMKEQDEVLVILPFTQAQQLVFGRGASRASSIMVQLERTEQMAQAAERLRTMLAEVAPELSLAVLDFKQINPFYVQTVDLFDTIFGFIFVLISGIVLFTVSNTMNASVVERTTEIGTVRAIGTRQAGIRRLFLVEGVLLGVAGAVAGLASAVVISTIINALNLTWLPPGGSVRLPLTVRVWGEHQMMLLAATGLIVVAALSAWWPAYRAAKLKIVEALRHV